MGRQQSFTIRGTITPVPTISRIGTLYTTVPPTTVPVAVGTGDGTAAPAEPAVPQGTVPVPKRTTYAPVSPATILGALGVAGCAALCLMRK
jgi:hypothetical protein